jgi:O-antigen/teichoic acid export membrane protein
MLKKIIETVGTRFFVAFINIFLLIFNAKTLGTQGVGTIGLILATSTIIVVLNDVFCGGGLVFLIPKYEVSQLILFPVLMSFVSSFIACALLFLIGVLKNEYLFLTYFLSVILTLGNVTRVFLLGKEKIRAININDLIQPIAMVLLLLFCFLVLGRKSVNVYLFCFFTSSFCALIYSFFSLSDYIILKKLKMDVATLKVTIHYGFLNQLANIAQQLNYRLNYFFIQKYVGLGGLGQFDAATKVSESSWIISRSIASIELSSIANRSELVYARNLTIRLFKLNFFVILLFLVFVLLIPNRIYTDYLFNKDFVDIKQIILYLSAGILFLACCSIFSSYFSGIGLIYHNTISSSVGLVVLLLVGVFLIPLKGIFGAAITCSASYFASFLYLYIVFVRKNKVKFREFIPNKEDILFAKERLKLKF